MNASPQQNPVRHDDQRDGGTPDPTRTPTSDTGPVAVDAGAHQAGFSMPIDAPAIDLWELVADSHRHHEVDGSGTVQAQVTGPEQLSVGDRFSVHMRKFGLRYVMTSTTTQAEPGRVLEWELSLGHRWRWEFAPLDGDNARTLVTETFDYSRVPGPLRLVLRLLRVPAGNARGIRETLIRVAERSP